MAGDLRIPFTHEDRDGDVVVRVKRIATGAEAGFDILANLPFGPEAAAGYPSMSATLVYAGEGYRQLMGWIQIVHSVRSWRDGRVDEASEVDLGPVWQDTDLPFLALGYLPSAFDAPARNLRGADALDWRADMFLTTVPRRTRAEPIRRLASFTWGYRETDTPPEPPTVFPPRRTEHDAWTRALDLLRRRFPGWVWAPPG
ncbi:hypothetical protein [Jidongwangia harbinensis]|uniref:hypothetical protein n=1 Tax=Jidongwangia harbinensis TaxID=2878561 RepID=UPI001CD9B29F|nr:hypothetical protein [Jidongwangia harbinensis]MCA2211584.1 hypothetical protein [Jidongwangia harbinensis]